MTTLVIYAIAAKDPLRIRRSRRHPESTATGHFTDDRRAASLHRSTRRQDPEHRKTYSRKAHSQSRNSLVAHHPRPRAHPCPLVWLEVGQIDRFPRAEHLASYAGLVPRIIASGGHIRHGGTFHNVNHYLKWAFVEAANVAIRMKACRQQHIGLLYHRLYPAKGHGRAAVAVARHLAEAAYWVLRKRQSYRAPQADGPVTA